MRVGLQLLGAWCGAVLSLASPWIWAAGQVTVGSDPSKTVLVGTVVTPDEVIDGKVVVEGDTITCVQVDCDEPAGATVIRVTNAFIFPGFVDAHNHVAYNVLPKWTPPKVFQNRGQWQANKSYAEFKKPYADLKAHLFCEMVKYGEIKALLSGVTTIQGTSPNSSCFKTLIRNAENQNQLGLPANHIRTFILDIKSFKGDIDWIKTKSFVVHLSEGIDEKSRAEFDTLKAKHLLAEGTAIIHGTAFGTPEFKEMAAVGAKLIWSPQSNLALYQQTTKINLAYAEGVLVSLGVDWNPSGSDNIFDELRVAAKVNEEQFDGVIPDADFLKMITVNPARTLALQDRIGQLKPGFKADITVLRQHDGDPHRSLQLSRLQDVEMVWVGGDLLYGNAAIVQKAKPNQCESLIVKGSQKRVCVTDTKDPVAGSTETLEQIRTKLLARYSSLAPLAP